MPSIGSIRVDFLADVTKFVSGVNAASTSVSRFVFDVQSKLKGLEKVSQQFGAGMTVKVSAPLVAGALAAVKAADTNGTAIRRMQQDAENLQKSIAPIGREIIRGYESMRPAIESVTATVRRAGEAFERLPASTKNMILSTLAVTAAVGPAALAISAMTKVAGAAVTPFVLATGAVAKLSAGTTTLTAAMNAGTVSKWFKEFEKGNPSIVMAGKGMLILATAAAAFSAGSWIGKQGWMQNLMGTAVNHLRSVWGNWFGWMKANLLEIKGIALKVVGEIMATVGMAVQKGTSMLPSAVSSRMGFVSGGGKALETWGNSLSAAGDQADVAAMMKRYSMLQDYFGSQSGTGQFARSLMGPWSRGPGFLESMQGDFAKITGWLERMFTIGPAAANTSNEAWGKWNQTVKNVSKNFQDLQAFAGQINTKYTPEIQKLQAELDKLNMLQVEGLVGPNGPLSVENWEKAVTDIRAQIKTLQEAGKDAWIANFRAAGESYRSAVERVQAEYLQMYPEAGYNADLKRLRDLQEQFLAIGDSITANLVGGIIDAKEAARLQQVQDKVMSAFDDVARKARESSVAVKASWVETLGKDLSAGIAGFSRTWGNEVADMAIDGKFAFADIGRSFSKMIISMSAQAAASPLFEWFGGVVGKAFAPVKDTPLDITPLPNPGGLEFATGGITNRPFFTAVAGEAGREVIAPLSQLPNLLRQAGLGASSVQIIDQRSGGSPVQVRESRGPDGRRLITAVIKDAMASGEMDSVMSQRFNTRANPR